MKQKVWGLGCVAWIRKQEQMTGGGELAYKKGNKAKRGCQESNSLGEDSPGRGDFSCWAEMCAGRWALVGKLEEEKQPVGQETGQSGFNPGAFSPRSTLPFPLQFHELFANEHEPRFLLGACSSQCFRPLLPRFPALSLTNPRANSHDAAPAGLFTTCHIKAALSWQRPSGSLIGQTRTPASHTAVDWCRFLVSAA